MPRQDGVQEAICWRFGGDLVEIWWRSGGVQAKSPLKARLACTFYKLHTNSQLFKGIGTGQGKISCHLACTFFDIPHKLTTIFSVRTG